MDSLKLAEYSALATQAILETLGQSKGREGAVNRALEHINDDLFNGVLKGTAQGMSLELIRMDPEYGILLRSASARGPFAPTLGWLNKRLGVEVSTNTERSDVRKTEIRLLSGLMLVALLSDLFPTADSVRLEWDSSLPVDPDSVVKKLNEIAESVQRFHQADDENTFTRMAQIITEERVPKVSREMKNSISATRSQREMAQRWIKVLHEQGLLIEDKGLTSDTQWMATRRLKAYIKEAGILPLVDSILSMQKILETQQHEEGEGV